MAKRKKPAGEPNPLELFKQFQEQLKHLNLLKRLEEGLRIPGFGPSRHIITRGDPPERVEFFPDRCWAIQVMPSFHNRGLFAVFESRSLIRCAFVCKGDMPDRPGNEYLVVDHVLAPADWSDPVLRVFERHNWLPTPDRSRPEGEMLMSNDGVSYSFIAETGAIDIALRFSNPREDPPRALERAAYRAAAQVSAAVNHPQVSSFVRTWKAYLRGEASE